MRRPLCSAGVAATSLVAVAALLLSGCEGGSPAAAPAPAASTTPLSELAPGSVSVAREQFCARVAPAAVVQALGASPASAQDYLNGERAQLVPGVTDVAHEYGCRWTAADGTTLRAWLFAPPVTSEWARRLRGAAVHAKGCTEVPDAPDFGSPGVAVRCESAEGEVVAFHGLFGDAWLSCSLETAAGDALDRASRWCATVVAAASA